MEVNHDEAITDILGLFVLIISTISLTESLLQIRLIGNQLPLLQGTLLSLFAIGFGSYLLTDNASKLLGELRTKYPL